MQAAMSNSKAADTLFGSRNLDQEIIVLCIRWYLSYKHSPPGLAELLDERVLLLANASILRWVKRFTRGFVQHGNGTGSLKAKSWDVEVTYFAMLAMEAARLSTATVCAQGVDGQANALRDRKYYRVDGICIKAATRAPVSLGTTGVVQNPCFLRYTDELIRPAFSSRINMECKSV
jgi:hypothetical protein